MAELKLIIQLDADEPEAAEVYVDGTLDERPHRFLLDTGAAKSNLAFDSYTATLPVEGKHQSSGVFAPSADDLVTVRQIIIGPIERQAFTLTRLSPTSPRQVSLLGMDLLKDYCCHFYFDEARVILETSNRFTQAFTFEPLQMDAKFHPYVKVQLGDAQADSVWDTGASLTVVDTHFIQRHPSFFTLAGTSIGTDSAGAQMETPIYILSGAVIGNHQFPPHRVAGVDLSAINTTLDMPMDMILGYSTLSKANWLFDFPGKQWVISQTVGR
jgi:hypothetical protein